MRFADRHDAGRRLAELLVGSSAQVVLGMPRGGVPVAAEVAQVMQVPLDVCVARKIGLPDRPEVGIGAVAEDGLPVWDTAALHALGLRVESLADALAHEQQELVRRIDRYRGGRPLSVRGLEVLLVDDGLATGVTARAALRALRRLGAARLVLAVPVAPPDALSVLATDADEVRVVLTPRRFRAVGEHYDDFDQLTDVQVLAELEG